MKLHWSMPALAVCLPALLALQCMKPQGPSPAARAADEAAVRSVNQAWYKAYNAGDVNSVVALYAEDAVVSGPAAAAARGQAAVREFFTKDIAGATAGGVVLNGSTTTDVGVGHNNFGTVGKRLMRPSVPKFGCELLLDTAFLFRCQ